MRLRHVLVAATCLAAALVAPRAGLAATHDVSVSSNFFTPALVQATAGDTINWQVTGGSHDVTSYGGGQNWASGGMSSSSPPYTQTFGGGTAWYRCTPHSSVDPGGTCSGMCGVVTDKTGAPATPSIASPAEGSTGNPNPVTIAGTGEAWMVVQVKEGAVVRGRALVRGDGTWSVPVSLSEGEHTLTATGLAPDDTPSTGTATVTFSVTEDDISPTVAISSPDDLSIVTGPVAVSGNAQDNIGVTSISVTARSVLLGMTKTVVATCNNCPSTLATWSALLDPAPGIYALSAVAGDASGNTSNPSDSITIIVL